MTKNSVTLYNYNDPQNPTYRGVPKNQDVKVLDQETKWWKVKYGKFIGYASKYYFAAKNVKNSYESEPWFFGSLSRGEADSMLNNEANPHGAFLVRNSARMGHYVLDIKYLNMTKKKFENKHYDVKKTDGEFYFNQDNKFSSFAELIK